MEKFIKSVKNGQNYGHEAVAPFFGHPVYTQVPYLVYP